MVGARDRKPRHRGGARRAARPRARGSARHGAERRGAYLTADEPIDLGFGEATPQERDAPLDLTVPPPPPRDAAATHGRHGPVHPEKPADFRVASYPYATTSGAAWTRGSPRRRTPWAQRLAYGILAAIVAVLFGAFVVLVLQNADRSRRVGGAPSTATDR